MSSTHALPFHARPLCAAVAEPDPPYADALPNTPSDECPLAFAVAPPLTPSARSTFLKYHVVPMNPHNEATANALARLAFSVTPPPIVPPFAVPYIIANTDTTDAIANALRNRRTAMRRTMNVALAVPFADAFIFD